MTKKDLFKLLKDNLTIEVNLKLRDSGSHISKEKHIIVKFDDMEVTKTIIKI